ncbi:MAG: P27 family phage terminase small subunit [Ruminococcus sp.]|nr:P27 family phage terminase small subunit [Ruminococcus sp.]
MAVSLKELRESLVEQLEAKDANVDCFLDLIDSYIFYTKKERAMQKDINKRGLFFKATSSAGKEYIKDNPSIKNAVMYNKQRLAILNQLGLTTENVEVDIDDEL